MKTANTRVPKLSNIQSFYEDETKEKHKGQNCHSYILRTCESVRKRTVAVLLGITAAIHIEIWKICNCIVCWCSKNNVRS